MAAEMRPLNLRGTIAMPQVVMLPSRVARSLGIPRRLTISKREQEAPEPVHTFLRGDPRYAVWFGEAASPSPESAAAPVEQGRRAAVTQTAELSDEQWSADQSMPVLRAYAAKYDVKLGNRDKKAAIVEKLRAARADFEVEPFAPGDEAAASPPEGTSEMPSE